MITDNDIISLFIEEVLDKLNEAITYEPISRQFKLNPPILINKGLSQTEWKHFETDARNLNIVDDVLKPTTSLGLERKDKKYIIKCSNNKYFYVTDDYLQKIGLYHKDNNEHFIPLTYNECMKLLASFRKTNAQKYPVYIDPEFDLNFQYADDFKLKQS